MKNLLLSALYPGAVCVAFLISGVLPSLRAATVNLVGAGEQWRYLVSTNMAEASTPVPSWRTNTFVEDGKWNSGSLPIGFATAANDPLGYEARIVTALPTASAANYTAVFLRKSFVVTNAAQFSAVTLGVAVDDGCVAWLNGVEIMRFQCCTAGTDASVPTANANALTATESALNTNTVFVTGSGPLLEGTNVLCVELFNANLTSSDLVFEGALSATVADTVPPTIANRYPPPASTNTVDQVTVTFSEPVIGVDAGDLLFNGTPAVAVTGGPDVYVFTAPTLPNGLVQITWAATADIRDLGTPPNSFDVTAPAASWNVYNEDRTAPVVSSTAPPQGATVTRLGQIEIIFSEEVIGVDAADLRIGGIAATNVEKVASGQFVFSFTQPPTGIVQVAWAPTHGIVDLASNAFLATTWTYNFDPNAVPPNVVISEFLAVNDKGLHDEDGDPSDWIELFNASSTPVNLAGWYLTDDQTSLKKWKFPSYVLGTNQYMVVFASGKNRTNVTGRLHTNFQLSKDGEFLGLVRDDGITVASSFGAAYPAQRTDVSFGRDAIELALTGYFTTPTPGARNVAGSSDFSPDVEFSRNSGTFVSPFSLALSLSKPSSNAVIRYVLATSGSTATNIPTATSPIYTNPIPISATMVVRARAFVPGQLPGDIHGEAYIQINTNTLGFQSDLPIIVLHNHSSGTIPSASDQFVMMQVFEPKNGKSSITNAPDLSARGIFHLRGSSTLGLAKGSFFVETQTEYGDGRNVPLLGMPQESDWVFYAPNNFEPVLIHNPAAHEIGRQIGRYSSRTRFAVVLLNTAGGALTLPTFTSGNYNGIYVIEEKIKIDKNRVDIDKVEAENNTPPTVTGGYLLSVDRLAAGETALTAGGQALNYINPHWSDMNSPQFTPQRTYISNYFNSLANAVNGVNYTNPVTGYTPFVDVDAWIDHSILNVVTFNVDALRLSGYLYKPRNGPVAWGPIWDFDRTQGSTDGRDFNPRTFRSTVPDLGTDFFNPQSNGVQWWGRMFTDPNFFQKWVDRYQEFRADKFANTNVYAVIDNLANQVKTEQPREQARWAFNPRSGAVSAGGFTYTFSGGYTGEVAWMKAWYSNRLDFIDTNFLARPKLSSPGGMITPGFEVTITPPAKAGSSVYYTLDGTDPRALHGGISPTAILYAGGPITLTNNTRLTARSYNPTHRNLTGANNPPISVPWSGPIGETYVVRTPELAITEIMFHPGPVSGSDTNDVDNYEYLEIKNVGTNLINLIGFRFTNGIDFTFTATNPVTSLAPGNYLLLVKNLAAFTNRYGIKPNIAGAYDGNLDNAGERLVLVGRASEVVLDFTYNDAWNTLADGSGFSLVLADEATNGTNYSNAASWRQSNIENGSPGVVDPGARSLPGIIISEALTRTDVPPPTDTIELQNLDSTNVNIGGWFLSDDFDNPKKYVIPAGTIIPSGGFITFNESQFNVPPRAFSLSSEGDSVWLFSGDGLRLTGGYHGFGFGPAQNQVSFGRYVNSQTNEFFVPQAQNTLGGSNSLPRVGPVVISEIHYHPPELGTIGDLTDNSMDEFVELQNITTLPVPLYDTARPTNTWKISKGVDFLFPLNVTLPANGFALVVNFDPSFFPAQESAFRSKFGVPASVPIFGPLGGKLDNSSEAVKLSRPELPNVSSGFIPYVEVDRVEYSDAAPWAGAADGFGPSLQRLVSTTFANDPTNWIAALPTAGVATSPGTPPVITGQPEGGNVVEHSTASLNVTANGAPPLAYQWRFNGSALPGATNSTLVIQDASPANTGVYNVAVFNNGGAVMSSSATVSVAALPRITLNPTTRTNVAGTNTTFTVQATGTGLLRYQWRMNSNILAGATNSSLTISNLDLFAHSGFYDVVVTDNIGSTISQPAILVATVKPQIIEPPIATRVVPGGSAVFRVVAGPIHPLLPLSYRWFLTNGTAFNNTGTVFVVTNCQSANSVRLAVSSAGGQVSVTTGILITLLADADGDGIPDDWEDAYGLNKNSSGDATLDSDGDGMTNVQEYIAGTNPLDPQSYLRFDSFRVGSNDQAVLTFNAVSNRLYQVQQSDALPVWTNFATFSPATNSRNVSVTNSAAGVPSRYYRIQIPTQ